MNVRTTTLLLSLLPTLLLAQTIEPIARRLPPQGTKAPADRVAKWNTTIETLNQLTRDPDVRIFTKAVSLAIRHQEFYKKQDVDIPDVLLREARKRLAPGWKSRKHSGPVVFGYTSSIDNSPQPYGLEIPEKLDQSKPATLYVWLHGRGDKTTDLHFINQRLKGGGKIQPPNAMVLQPFGRQCMGFKSAGEIDVLESIADVQKRFSIDPDRIVLMGFSMGGAGVWHIGAHYTDRWVAMSPGAGFSETRFYNRLTDDKLPPAYEQTLWKTYDVPNYTRNLFNLPLVAYSGENDKQIQAARIMEEAFTAHQRTLTHLIGPGMGHKYHPNTQAAIMNRMSKAAAKGRNPKPHTIHLQTPTLRYNRMHWVEILGLEEHWKDSRVDTSMDEAGVLYIQTKNVSALRVDLTGLKAKSLQVNGVVQPIKQGSFEIELSKRPAAGLRKEPGLQGPIDDAFLEPFIVVRPAGKDSNPKIQAWIDFEIAHLAARWLALYRADLPIISESQLTPEHFKRRHIVLFGSPESSKTLRRLLTKLPLNWDKTVDLGAKTFSATNHIPVMIYPNPISPDHYLVINSGPTFRENHDRTNSLQNPKLPDWAILNIDEPPTGDAAGRVVAADFFDEGWQVKP